MQAGIFPENEVSISLHKSCGFKKLEYGKRSEKWMENGVMLCLWKGEAQIVRFIKKSGV